MDEDLSVWLEDICRKNNSVYFGKGPGNKEEAEQPKP